MADSAQMSEILLTGCNPCPKTNGTMVTLLELSCAIYTHGKKLRNTSSPIFKF